MAVTPFLKLQKPPFDTIPWDEAVNGNMDTIDAFIQRYMAVPNYVGGWANSTNYVSGQNVLDITNAIIYQCVITHTSSATPTTFAQDRTTHPTYWLATQNVITGGAGNTVLTIAEATPLTAKAGDLWWDSLGGQLYVMYNDGNSMQWVIANNQAGNVGEAPNDGSVYGRRMSAWTPISQGNVGRNLIHNSMFNIAQRGAGSWTANGYTVDRWQIAMATDTASFAQTVANDTTRAQIGDEAATYYLASTFTGNAAAGALTVFYQSIEGVRRLSNKTVTISFWAIASVAGMKLGASLDQGFGFTGSPSAGVSGTGQSVTLTTAFARYSLTFTLPSTAGKTLGTDGRDATTLYLWYSSGATNAARSGNVGVQSGTINIWGVQLEIAQPGQTQPTPLEKPDPRHDLANCQRFYEYCKASLIGYGAATMLFGQWINFMQQKRAIPTIVVTGGTASNATALTGDQAQVSGFRAYATVTATANAYWNSFDYTASADL